MLNAQWVKEIMSKTKKIRTMDILGVCGIGMYCVFSSLFESIFSKIHIKLPFLNFPLFLGEMLLMLTVGLLTFKYFYFKEKFNVRPWVLYAIIVLIYIVVGYLQWGPLALRNGAMFLYVIFALGSYHFYSSLMVQSEKLKWVALAFIFAVLILHLIGDYYWYTYVILFTMFIINKLPKKYAWFIPVFLVLFQMDIIFSGARAHLMGVLTGVIYLTVISVFFFIKLSKRWQWGIIITVFICFFLYGIKKEPNAMKSMTDLATLSKLYINYSFLSQERRQEYQPPLIKSRLYNPPSQRNISSDKFLYSSKISNRFLFEEKDYENKESILTASTLTRNMEIILSENVNSMQSKNVEFSRNLDVAYHNSLFRVFIWQDMMNELFRTNIIFGVGLGKPQRSVTIEVLGWADTEWKRDGWIAPHNSYLHFLYRAGVFGFIVLFLLFKVLFDLTKIFIQRKNIYGILLLSILVYWVVMAAFSVILEVPYYAIFFWSLLGVTYAYAFPKTRSIK